MPKKKTIIKKHILIPLHVKLTEKEKKTVLEKYYISINELPKISQEDPAIARLNAKIGDIIKISRQSPISGETYYYRVVVNE